MKIDRTLYAVNRHFDQIREKSKRETFMGEEKYHYFDTENEAREFIRHRAFVAFGKADAAANAAARRVDRVRKNFPAIPVSIPPAQSADGDAPSNSAEQIEKD